MPLFTHVAGFQNCTLIQAKQQSIAQITALILFIALCIGTFFLFRALRKSNLDSTPKYLLYLLLGIVAVPVCLGIPLIAALLIAPWCT